MKFNQMNIIEKQIESICKELGVFSLYKKEKQREFLFRNRNKQEEAIALDRELNTSWNK